MALAQVEPYPPTLAFEHGVGVRFCLPKGSEVLSVQLNGSELPKEEWPTWDAAGFTWVEVHAKNRPVDRPPRCRFAHANVVVKYES